MSNPTTGITLYTPQKLLAFASDISTQPSLRNMARAMAGHEAFGDAAMVMALVVLAGDAATGERIDDGALCERIVREAKFLWLSLLSAAHSDDKEMLLDEHTKALDTHTEGEDPAAAIADLSRHMIGSILRARRGAN